MNITRRRRWLRFAIPLGLVAVFWAVTFVAHLYEQVNPLDPGILSPAGTGRHGSSQLADRLRARGVLIEPVTSTDAALEAARRNPDATIFVPLPDLLNGRLILELAQAPGNHRVVFVRPGGFGRAMSLVPARLFGSRWATTTAQPGCSADYAAGAGTAAVHRDRYSGFASFIEGEVDLTERCYGGSLIEFALPGTGLHVIWAGATDPFRNDRIGEVGNAALATALLGSDQRVIWLDVHTSEARVALPGLDLPDYGRPDRDRDGEGGSIESAFPPQLWAVVVLLLGAALLLAFARARRLGPPVAEPLPVLVPAVEATLGRGRLYRRIKAREASLTVLRSAALAQLARAVDPLTPAPSAQRAVATPGPGRDSFIHAVAVRAGVDEATVGQVLFGAVPEDDAGLVVAARAVDGIVAAALRGPPASPSEPGSTPPVTQPHSSGGSP